jgi:hypothetical protein
VAGNRHLRNASFCNQTVTVVIVPVIDCPADIVNPQHGPAHDVTYNVTAVDADGALPVTCVPPSGTGFRVGTSNVVCSASNSNAPPRAASPSRCFRTIVRWLEPWRSTWPRVHPPTSNCPRQMPMATR